MNGTLDVTLDEVAALNLLKVDGKMTLGILKYHKNVKNRIIFEEKSLFFKKTVIFLKK